MFKIHIRDIIEINDSAIIYRNERGENDSIELAPCADSYEKSYNMVYPENFKHRCVGERSFGEYAYYELYTTGHTHLYLKLRTNAVKRFITRITGWNFHAKEFQLFYSVQKQLNEHGWTTMDLS